MWCIRMIFLCLTVSSGLGKKKVIYLGGLFDENTHDEPIFRAAVDYANDQNYHRNIKFRVITSNITIRNSYETMSITCSFLKEKIVAIFGPQNGENINTVQSVCDYKDVAHIITQWVSHPQHNSIVNFYPHAETLNRAYYDIISRWGWKSFTLFYEDDDSLLRVSNLISKAKNAGIQVAVKQINDEGHGIYRTALKQGLTSGETNYVIDCRTEILEQVLIHAQQVGMMTSNYKYFITNLNTHTINLEPFQYSDANVTAIKMIEQESPVFRDFGINITEMTVERALLIDAVITVARAIANTPFRNFEPDGAGCDSPKSLKLGTTLSNAVKSGGGYGMTGRIEFDNDRFRSEFQLEISELNETGIVRVGTWYSDYRNISLDHPLGVPFVDDPSSLRNKNLTVVTCLTDPYGMRKESAEKLSGNDRFEGYGIDLIHELSLMEGFDYVFYIREDKANGKKLPNGSWSGMIGDVMNGKYDLAITDLTITAERETAVDFTSPFMTLGVSILAKKPEDAPPSFFSFADPFALDTWTMLALAYVVVSLSYFVLGRISPDEWTNPYPCIEEPEFLLNQFSLKNSCWFAMGSLMQQGTEIAPIAISTRMVAGMWWFFVLLMVSSYTANLAAFLTVENPINLFTDLETLVQNKDKYNIKMGAKSGGATAQFFKSKENEDLFREVSKYMEAHDEDMVGDNKDGVKKAEEEAYVFFMESTSIDYEIHRHCDLQRYGSLLDDKGYGIAMKKNSTYRKRLSTAILKLQASGKLDDLKRKWWQEKRGGGQCDADAASQQATPLGLKNVEGVFYVTIGGTIISVLFVIAEMIVASIKLSVRAKIPLREALGNEMKAYFNFNSNVKPVIQEKSESKSGSGSRSGKSQTFNNNLKPAPYGFIPPISISKEDLAEEI